MRTELSGLVKILLPISAVIWLLLELRQSRVSRPGARLADRGSRDLVVLAFVTGFLGAVLIARWVPSARVSSTAVLGWIGLLLIWAGVGLRLWAFRTLGRYFTFTVQTSTDQPVITGGPYRLLRHPSYTGLLVALIGMGCFIGNWLSLLFLAACSFAGLAYRISIEEKALLASMGERYRSFAASRKRLIPFVW